MKTVIEMAREAGLLTIGTADGSEAVYTWPKGITEEIERFADLVRADAIADERDKWMERAAILIRGEREACAKMCEELVPDVSRTANDASVWDVATFDCAAAIRARGENT